MQQNQNFETANLPYGLDNFKAHPRGSGRPRSLPCDELRAPPQHRRADGLRQARLVLRVARRVGGVAELGPPLQAVGGLRGHDTIR
jgi:hypothetical protein